MIKVKDKIMHFIGYVISIPLSFFQGMMMQSPTAIYPFFVPSGLPGLLGSSTFILMHGLIGREVIKSQKTENLPKLSISSYIINIFLSIIAFITGLYLSIIIAKRKYATYTMMGLEPMYGVYRSQKLKHILSD